MGLDYCGLLIRRCLLLGFSKLLDQTHWAALETALEATAGTGMDELSFVSSCERDTRHKWAYFNELTRNWSQYFDMEVNGTHIFIAHVQQLV